MTHSSLGNRVKVRTRKQGSAIHAILPAIQKSFAIYEYKCHCDSRYVGRTAQRLQDRIKQHVSKWLRQHTASQRVQPNRACKRKQFAPECDSAIGHL